MSMFNPIQFSKLVLPFDEFKPFLTIGSGNPSFPDKSSAQGKSIIAEGEKALEYEPKILPLSKYIMFTENGDRHEYESVYFERRSMLLHLLLAELCEKSGRFTEKMMDLLFAVLEESTWVIPAHNYSADDKIDVKIAQMPEPVGENVWAIDLFSAATGALVALIYYFMRDSFEKKIPGLFNRRIHYELEKKLIRPYLSTTQLWWMGYRTESVNNWNPWINSSMLTVAAYSVHDDETRRALARKCAECINFYTDCLPADGGCDEGPNYWGAAGACVVNFAEIGFDMTGGKYSVFRDPLLTDTVKYITKVNIAGNYYFNCADAHAESEQEYGFIRRFGKLSGDNVIYGFGNEMMKNSGILSIGNAHRPESRLRMMLDTEPDMNISYSADKTAYLPTLQIAAVRESENVKKGFYLGIKGGHNAENHNHFDVGNFIVYCDGEPMIIDPGVGTYTKFTFISETRYKMFAFRTEDHNLPEINGVGQWTEREHHADGFTFEPEKGRISVELKNAYRNKSEILSFFRTASLANSEVTVNDKISLKNPGKADFRLWLADRPEKISDNEFILSGKAVLKLSLPQGFTAEAQEIPLDDPLFRKDWKRTSLYRIIAKPAESFAAAEIAFEAKITHK